LIEGEKPNWPSYLSERATRAGVDPAAVEVSAEKPGTSAGETKESLFDVQLKHVSIRQVVNFAFGLETADKPVKVRTLSIDTNADPTGYMDATLSVSAFSLVASTK
jgi:hypothetical protein